MITVSGLRYDALTSEKMPKLFEFATSSTQFTNHYSSGNTNNAGLVGLFYGLNANYTDSILSNHTPSVLIKSYKMRNINLSLIRLRHLKTVYLNKPCSVM